METKKILSVLLLSFLPFLTIQAQNWLQNGQNLVGADDENFGTSVSLSSDGSVLAIGAPWHFNSTNESVGRVSIYKNQSGIWTKIGQDIEGEADQEGFGIAVSLSSNGLVVAIMDMNFPGRVRIFENQDEAWVQTGQDIDDEISNTGSSGSTEVLSLNFDGSILAIGTPGNDGNGYRSGHVRIFENQAETWVQTGQDIDGDAANDHFGTSVSLSYDGSIVAIGAPGNNGSGEDAGHVRIYEYQNETWVQTGQDIDGEAANDWFGTSISLSSNGSIVAIGAPGNSENGYISGHARIYENQNGGWSQIGLDLDGKTNEDYFGKSVSLSSDGRIVAIGAPDHTDYTGQARVYENINNTWTPLGQDIEGEGEDFFGSSLSLSSNGSIVAIGAPLYSDFTNGTVGNVRVFSFGSSGISSNFRNNQLSLHPNPTTGKLSLTVPTESIGNILVLDIFGKHVLLNKTNKKCETIDLSPFECGIYTIRVQTKNETFTTKIIKR